nr:DUF4013 domain-containing protein [uncultured Methanobrevibacter sp.]
MEIMEIIKDAFVFPSKNAKVLLIYIILTILVSAFSIMGAVIYALGFIVPEYYMWGGIAGVIALLIGWVMSGYMISVIKSGIDLNDEVPEFVWWDNFITGFNSFIISIVYFLIPAVIVVFVGLATNVFGNIYAVVYEFYSQILAVYLGYSSTIAMEALSQAMVNLVFSLTITLTAAVVVFVIFSFIQTMAEARLANTGSLGEALNVLESAKDIKRIGIGKTIAVIILIFIVVGIINAILSFIFGYVPFLSILSLFISPYLVLFTQRAVGLLYSDIA